jgi:hypothetical protein
MPSCPETSMQNSRTISSDVLSPPCALKKRRMASTCLSSGCTIDDSGSCSCVDKSIRAARRTGGVLWLFEVLVDAVVVRVVTLTGANGPCNVGTVVLAERLAVVDVVAVVFVLLLLLLLPTSSARAFIFCSKSLDDNGAVPALDMLGLPNPNPTLVGFADGPHAGLSLHVSSGRVGESILPCAVRFLKRRDGRDGALGDGTSGDCWQVTMACSETLGSRNAESNESSVLDLLVKLLMLDDEPERVGACRVALAPNLRAALLVGRSCSDESCGAPAVPVCRTHT